MSRNVVLTSASCLYYHEQKRWSYAEELYVIHGNFSIPNDWGGKSFEVEVERVVRCKIVEKYATFNKRLSVKLTSESLSNIKVMLEIQLIL